MGNLISGGNSRPSVIRMFLKADSAEELVRLQLRMNVSILGRADYTDFSNVDGVWYCWFKIDVDHFPEILKQLMPQAEEVTDGAT